ETPALIPAPPVEEAAEEEREEVPYVIPQRHVEKKEIKVVEREVIPPVAEPSSSSRRPALPAEAAFLTPLLEVPVVMDSHGADGWDCFTLRGGQTVW
ncbi:unnamed protein product, partial [Symbiodinium pilosum]